MARKWEQGKCSTNPFEYNNDGALLRLSVVDVVVLSFLLFFIFMLVVTVSSVRFELALEEETEILAGNIAVVHKEVTPSKFVLQGLNLEDAM